MSQIKYNKKEEAFEIEYSLWENKVTIRFYVEEEKEIMDNFSEIAQKLDRLNRNKTKISELVVDEGYYSGASEILNDNIQITKAYIDIDEDGVVVCFTVDSIDGYMKPLNMELSADNGIEVLGYDYI